MRLATISVWLIIPIIIIYAVWCRFGPMEHEAIYIVRHAEKLDSSADTALSPAGAVRADALAHVLAEIEVDGVFATNFQRTQQTAAPSASSAGLTIETYGGVSELVSEINANRRGDTLLVVGHSNTIGEIVELLGGPTTPSLADHQYDRLYLVQRARRSFWWPLFSEHTTVQKLRYGEPTP